jgi:hypothetical protein
VWLENINRSGLFDITHPHGCREDWQGESEASRLMRYDVLEQVVTLNPES